MDTRADKIFVTGATGFVGSNLVKRLTEEGKDVTALIVKGSGHPFLRNLRIKKVTGDIVDFESVKRGMNGCNLVYHVASLIRSPFHRYAFNAAHSVNIMGTKNVLNAALELGVERLVYTSTSAIFGISRNKNVVLNEGSAIHQDGLKNDSYAYTKGLAEIEVLKAYEKGLKVVIVNPSKINGPGDQSLKSGFLIKNIYENKISIAPPGGRGVVSVDDVVEGHLLAMKNGKPGEHYILSNENMEYIEIVKAITESLGSRGAKIRIPELFNGPLYSLTLLIERAASLLGKENEAVFLNSQTVREMFGFQYVSSEKAMNELGWRPKSNFRMSIERAFDYYKSEGLI